MTKHLRRTERGRAVLIATACLCATLAAAGSPGSARSALAAPSAAARSAATSCQRDTASDVRWVLWLYHSLLGRASDLAEAAGHLPKLGAGNSYAAVADGIASSDEALRRRVRGQFEQLLHRSPSNQELTGWVPWTRRHGSAHLAAELAGSGEAYRASGSTAAGWIGQVYLDVLGHQADSGGLTYWTGRLTSGATRARIALEIWGSPANQRRLTAGAFLSITGRNATAADLGLWTPVAMSRGERALAVRLAATQSAWSRAQLAFGAPASALPPTCPPPVPNWIPAPGTVVHDLTSQAALGPKLVALTFDDGPNPTWTPKVLDVLDRYNVPSTFFLVGNQAELHPDLVRQIAAEGHHLAVHTMSHPSLPTLTASAQRREIVGAADLIDRIAGAGSVRCMRPPYGNRNATTIQIARDRGLAVMIWSRDGRDWAMPGVDTIVNGNLDTRYDGGRGLILLHDGGLDRSQTVDALPRLIESLRGQGYRFVQVC